MTTIVVVVVVVVVPSLIFIENLIHIKYVARILWIHLNKKLIIKSKYFICLKQTRQILIPRRIRIDENFQTSHVFVIDRSRKP